MTSLPAGWSPADIAFLIARVKEWPIVMVDDPTLGIPCVQDLPQDSIDSDEYGVAFVKTPKYKLTYYLTPLPSGTRRWTHVDVVGEAFPYDKESVLKRLGLFAGGTASKEPVVQTEADLIRDPPKEPLEDFALFEQPPEPEARDADRHQTEPALPESNAQNAKPEPADGAVDIFLEQPEATPSTNTPLADDSDFNLLLEPAVISPEPPPEIVQELPPSLIDLSVELFQPEPGVSKEPGSPEAVPAPMPLDGDGTQAIVYEWAYADERQRLLAVGEGTIAVCPRNRMRGEQGPWRLYYKTNFLAVTDPKSRQPIQANTLEELVALFEAAFDVKVVLHNAPEVAVEIPLSLSVV